MMEKKKTIGEKIKNFRESKSLTFEEVATRSSLTHEQLERIEENACLPSLAPLIRIARTLGVRLGTFLDDDNELGPVICRKEDCSRQEGINFNNNSDLNRKHMTYHPLSQDKSGRHMEPFLVDVDASDGAKFELSSHEGEEFIYVLEGQIEINYGKENYLLTAGDSIYYDSVVSHHVHAADGSTARILGIVYTPF